MNRELEYAEKDFGKILKKNAQDLRHGLLEEGTDCFRVYDRNLSTFPVTVDLYGLYAKITDFGEEPLAEDLLADCLDLCSRMLYLEKDHVIYAHRAKRTEGQQHEKTELSPITSVVNEHGLKFKVDLTSHIDTGLFLDHSITRQFVQSRSAGADVLNLFSYTGSFSVYAAAGLAHTVTSVDMSATYSSWAEENLKQNGFSGENYPCVCQDARKFIEQAYKDGKKYDIIIFDPPSFSNSHKMDYDFDVERDYSIWIKNLFALLKKSGILIFSTNLSTFCLDKRKLRGISVKEVTTMMWAPGFVKGRNGTVRSWIMAFDDESLSLDWSEPKKETGKERQQERRSYGSNRGKSERREYSDRPRREYNSDRPRREYSDRDRGERREYSDRPRREYNSDRPRREYSDRDRGERREYSDRPRREYNSDRPREKAFGRNEWNGEKKPYQKSNKPYGFDTFKPARSRSDSSEFFWNVEDLEKKDK